MTSDLFEMQSTKHIVHWIYVMFYNPEQGDVIKLCGLDTLPIYLVGNHRKFICARIVSQTPATYR